MGPGAYLRRVRDAFLNERPHVLYHRIRLALEERPRDRFGHRFKQVRTGGIGRLLIVDVCAPVGGLNRPRDSSLDIPGQFVCPTIWTVELGVGELSPHCLTDHLEDVPSSFPDVSALPIRDLDEARQDLRVVFRDGDVLKGGFW